MKHQIKLVLTGTLLLSFAGCQDAPRMSEVFQGSGQSPYESRISSKDILANLSPNMQGLAENIQEDESGIAFVNNSNDRMYIDDWRRALYLDKPSSLSPYAVIQD